MMQFTKADKPSIRAEKVSVTGALYYDYWIDQDGNELVQITKNVGGGGAVTGSFSSDLYRVKNLGTRYHLNGYDCLTGVAKTTSNRNMKAFLDAVLCDIIDKRENEDKRED